MKRLGLLLASMLGIISLFLFASVDNLTAQSDPLIATTKYMTALFSGPGNITCYSNIKNLNGGETLTLLGRAPGVCAPYPGHQYFYARHADGTEGWAYDTVLILPEGANDLPIVTPSATNTPTATPAPLTATTKYGTTLFSGPGNITCYTNTVPLPGGETLTLLGRAPGVCAPYPGHQYFYVRRANGQEGWAYDAVLNLPPNANNAPLMTPPPTNTPVGTPPGITATTKSGITLFSGPGNITCYTNTVPVPSGETLTLLGRAPGVCAPYPGHQYFYVRRANGQEGWAYDASLNLPPNANTVPLMTPPATKTPTPLPPTLTPSSVPPTATFTPEPPTLTPTNEPPTAEPPTATWTPEPPTLTPTSEPPTPEPSPTETPTE